MQRHFFLAAILWVVLTVIGEALALGANFLPLAAAGEAQIADSAFRLLMLLGIPVFTFVLAAVIYSLLAFRRRGEPAEDGAAIHGKGPVPAVWLLVTGALAVFVIFNPGLKGLSELHANHTADLVVQVEGARWFWTITYPQYNVTTTKELVLPLDKSVRFEVTSADVVHAFWVPAFRQKIDAVPGLMTTVYVTPNKTGTFESDFNLRVQCAELCGVGHSVMSIPVSVVEPAQFEAWVDEAQAGQ